MENKILKISFISVLFFQLVLAKTDATTAKAKTSSQLNSPGNSQLNSTVNTQFNGLGENTEVLERIKNLDSQQKVRVVQNRLVDRNFRLEIGLNYGVISGADTYVSTQNLGGSVDFHINPRWSLGLRLEKGYNKLSPEAEAQFEKSYQDRLNRDSASKEKFPEIDYMTDSQLATISYYPIYGKLNLFDNWISQFDLYTQLGYGQIHLYSGTSSLASLGLGSGIWINNHLSTRVEVLYQKYTDLNQSLQRNQSQLQLLVGVGILL